MWRRPERIQRFRQAGEGLQPVLVGISIGLLFAVLLTRFLKFFLLGVSATDVLTFTAVGVLLCLVALLACFLPACRATRRPMAALRHE